MADKGSLSRLDVRRSELASLAAHNNAAWCQALCRTHGCAGDFGLGGWASARRTPPYYPDAVTTDPLATASELLARVDNSVGCSVKDSFAALDLSAVGFEILFNAQWIYRPASLPLPAQLNPEHEWRVVTTAADLEHWAHNAFGAEGPDDLFRMELLKDPAVRVLEYSEAWGCVLYRTPDAVGVSNVFGPADKAVAIWAAVVHAAHEQFPGEPLVGYERGADLTAAGEYGFEEVGPLRVWMRQA